jgi:polar amino acid transport system substrate-binding protein
MKYLHLSKLILGMIFSLTMSACLGAEQNLVSAQRFLKMGLYTGSPTSLVYVDGGPRGIGYELGKSFALERKLEYSPTIFSKNAEVLDAVKNGDVDLVFTNASPDRAKFIHFSKTVIRIEKGYLIGPHSKISAASDVNQGGTKIGYSMGSNSQKELPEIIPHATLVETKSTKEAIELLKVGTLDGFSTNKAILYEMSQSIDGSRVLPEVIGYENIALGVPWAQQDRVSQLNQFVDQIISSGKLTEIIRRSGTRGIVIN